MAALPVDTPWLDEATQQRISATRVAQHTAAAAAAAAATRVRDAQAAYDTTPRGQADLTAAIERETDPARHAHLQARLLLAVQRHTATMRRWRDSSAYVLNQISRTAPTSSRVPALLSTLTAARCREHNVPPPPDHPAAHTAWHTHDPDGRVWATLVDVVPEHEATTTFMLPPVRAAAAARDTDRLLAAHYAHYPAKLIADQDVTAHMWVAAFTGRPYRTTREALDQALRHQPPLMDHDGTAAAGGRPGDAWHVLPVVGPLRVTGPHPTTTITTITTGWLALRARDGEQRTWTTGNLPVGPFHGIDATGR